MEDIIQLITKPDTLEEGVNQLKSQSDKTEIAENAAKEVDEKDRLIRQTQIGHIQKDKIINAGTSKAKTVDGVRIPINFQKKIVNTATTFEVGEPVTIVSKSTNENKQSKLADLLKKIWLVNRLNNKLYQLIWTKKAYTQSAIQFYISDIKPDSLMSKILYSLGFSSQKKEIKANVLTPKKGDMYPYFDAFGDMKAFVWEFATKNKDGEDISNIWIYTEKLLYKIDNATGSLVLIESLPHGFSKIPIVYAEQEEPEWYDVQEIIDRLEVSLSKLGASNDYSGHPMLKLIGEVENAPDKDEDGKAWIIPLKIDDDGNEIRGDVEFLTNPNSTESNKLELEKLEEYIELISQTPNVSLSRLKGIGDISAKAIRLLFLDAIMKAKQNEGDNRTTIERMINVILSGIVNTTNTALSSESKDLYFEIQFNSILPDDLKEASEVVTALADKGLIAKKTAIEYLSMNEDVEAEMEMIEADRKQPEPQE